MKHFSAIISLFWILGALSSFSLKAGEFITGDLIFVAEGNSDFSKAIAKSTSHDDTLTFIHVGIIKIENDSSVWVIEASSEEGVRKISFDKFLETVPHKDSIPLAVVKRVRFPFPIEKMIDRAENFLGQPYDWWFLPENGKMYCSELVYKSFIDENGNHIFSSYPMNFRDEFGNMPEFWIKLFGQLNQEVPEGLDGTNPNDMSRDPALIEVFRFF